MSAPDRRRRIGRSWLSRKPCVKAWLFLLNGIFLDAFFFALDPLAGVILGAYVALGPILPAMIWMQRGLTRLLGIAHLVPSVPLLGHLALRLASDGAGPRIAFDVWDVICWCRGARFVLGTPTARAAGASTETLG